MDFHSLFVIVPVRSKRLNSQRTHTTSVILRTSSNPVYFSTKWLVPSFSKTPNPLSVPTSSTVIWKKGSSTSMKVSTLGWYSGYLDESLHPNNGCLAWDRMLGFGFGIWWVIFCSDMIGNSMVLVVVYSVGLLVFWSIIDLVGECWWVSCLVSGCPFSLSMQCFILHIPLQDSSDTQPFCAPIAIGPEH